MAYLKVQYRASYNMYDPRARVATGLSKEDYNNIEKNYKGFKQMYKEDWDKYFGNK